MDNIKSLVTNRKATFEYEILQKLEAGIELRGTEAKSIRLGQVNISESHCRISNDFQAYLVNMNVAPYAFGNRVNHEAKRDRRLLLHRNEIRRLYGQSREKGLTLIPLKVYLSKGKIKVEIALVKGKKLFDKRETLKNKDAQIEIARGLRD